MNKCIIKFQAYENEYLDLPTLIFSERLLPSQDLKNV